MSEIPGSTGKGSDTPGKAVNPLARFAVLLSYLLPQHLLSRFIHRVMRIRYPGIKNALINWFCGQFNVDLSDAESSNPDDYPTFNAFFTRALAPGARSVDPDERAVICPVDGCLSQCGHIQGDMLLQAKGHQYSVQDLLGGHADLAARFDGGSFATIYLAPYDYHRIHMPCTGELNQMIFVPGRLFSVNAASVATVPRLFARNERVVSVFDTEYGTMAMALVGALNVGSIETVWAGEVTPGGGRRQRTWQYEDGPRIDRGVEMGRFNMGSTVIALFEAGRVSWRPDFSASVLLRMGQVMGYGTDQSVVTRDIES